MSLPDTKDGDPQREAVVTIEDLHKSYTLGHMELPVLKGLDLAFYGGEYVSIMGPSGSGKSTLLNILGCLDKPTGGRYLLGTDDVFLLIPILMHQTQHFLCLFFRYTLTTHFLGTLTDVVLLLLRQGLWLCSMRPRRHNKKGNKK